jgi:hypothetical protein
LGQLGRHCAAPADRRVAHCLAVVTSPSSERASIRAAHQWRGADQSCVGLLRSTDEIGDVGGNGLETPRGCTNTISLQISRSGGVTEFVLQRARGRARTGSRSAHPIPDRAPPGTPLWIIDACVQHLPGPSFVAEVGPRTYRGSWSPRLHSYGPALWGQAAARHDAMCGAGLWVSARSRKLAQ